MNTKSIIDIPKVSEELKAGYKLWFYPDEELKFITLASAEVRSANIEHKNLYFPFMFKGYNIVAKRLVRSYA